MTTERADLGFGTALGKLEESAPKPRAAPKTSTEQAAAAGFRGREAKVHQGLRRVRRRRTGRNVQFNLKVKPETIEEISKTADENGWRPGETVEQAVVLL